MSGDTKELGALASVLKKLETSVEEARKALDKHERTCYCCNEKIKPGDNVWCDSCGEPIQCAGCTSDVTEGYCTNCYADHEDEIRREVEKAAYPSLGIKRIGVPLPDQIATFLLMAAETCCGAEPKPCSRCRDAVALHADYVAQLGEVRA